MSNKNRNLLMLSMSVLAGGYNYDMDSSEYNERIIKKRIPNGVKEFEINGHKIYAINKKNAIRKANKKGIL